MQVNDSFDDELGFPNDFDAAFSFFSSDLVNLSGADDENDGHEPPNIEPAGPVDRIPSRRGSSATLAGNDQINSSPGKKRSKQASKPLLNEQESSAFATFLENMLEDPNFLFDPKLSADLPQPQLSEWDTLEQEMNAAADAVERSIAGKSDLESSQSMPTVTAATGLGLTLRTANRSHPAGLDTEPRPATHSHSRGIGQNSTNAEYKLRLPLRAYNLSFGGSPDNSSDSGHDGDSQTKSLLVPPLTASPSTSVSSVSLDVSTAILPSTAPLISVPKPDSTNGSAYGLSLRPLQERSPKDVRPDRNLIIDNSQLTHQKLLHHRPASESTATQYSQLINQPLAVEQNEQQQQQQQQQLVRLTATPQSQATYSVSRQQSYSYTYPQPQQQQLQQHHHSQSQPQPQPPVLYTQGTQQYSRISQPQGGQYQQYSTQNQSPLLPVPRQVSNISESNQLVPIQPRPHLVNNTTRAVLLHDPILQQELQYPRQELDIIARSPAVIEGPVPRPISPLAFGTSAEAFASDTPHSDNSSLSPSQSEDSKRKKRRRQQLSEDQKRRNHMSSERKRRDLIKQHFDRLFELVPSLSDQSPLKAGSSKSIVLSSVYDHMTYLVNRNKSLRALLAAKGISCASIVDSTRVI
ncbi:hypothetical protein AWJ20_3582 [Sugiyamaella lignohabitans]|uniref:BHLH domain-containing protein n=1 Tax=Sugiyamaella lignohabitans TaxID=796027 RepID=A0A167G0F6_9ASCO|nr:uncharacterized protein AWJ20_3582 [Sugiyamaella lignohabitans]ANB15938.1 hypothetical protein AWJ20_3582 [Sugiyamaella lignohabitans]